MRTSVLQKTFSSISEIAGNPLWLISTRNKLKPMLTLTLNDHGTLQRLENFAARAKNPRALLLAVGHAIADRQRQRLRETDASHPNKLTAPRTHYYNRIANSIGEPVL